MLMCVSYTMTLRMRLKGNDRAQENGKQSSKYYYVATKYGLSANQMNTPQQTLK